MNILSKLIILILALVIVVSPVKADFFKVTKKNFKKIEIGMSGDNVKKIIGRKPDQISESEMKDFGKTELWMYYSAGTKLGLKNKGMAIYFQNDKVISKDWME